MRDHGLRELLLLRLRLRLRLPLFLALPLLALSLSFSLSLSLYFTLFLFLSLTGSHFMWNPAARGRRAAAWKLTVNRNSLRAARPLEAFARPIHFPPSMPLSLSLSLFHSLSISLSLSLFIPLPFSLPPSPSKVHTLCGILQRAAAKEPKPGHCQWTVTISERGERGKAIVLNFSKLPNWSPASPARIFMSRQGCLNGRSLHSAWASSRLFLGRRPNPSHQTYLGSRSEFAFSCGE